jgi:uncharacterized linocin/CFP29 family protein
MVGRKLLPIFGPLGEGVVTYGYDTLTEVADARIDVGWPGAESMDIVNLARSTVAIPNIHKEFEINKLDLSASRLTGQPLNTSVVESASYKVGYMEDALIILGWSRDGTNYDINGLYKAAGNSVTGAGGWNTGANIVTDINAAIAELLTDNIYPPYNVTLHPDQYAETLALISSTAVSYLDWIKSVIQGEVHVTPAIAATTGMMTKANPEGMFEYVLAEDLTVATETLAKSANLFGKVYIRGLPVVYDSNAICTMATI